MPNRSNPPPTDAQEALLAADVGKAIAERRRALGLTQAQLAEAIDLEQEAISRWERGTRVPTLYRLQQLGDALDCPVDELLQRGSKRPNDQIANIADALKGLDTEDRALVVTFVQQLTDMLRSRHSLRGQRRK